MLQTASRRAQARSLNVRDSLALLVLGCIVPIAGVAAFLVFDYYEREQTRAGTDALNRVRVTIAAVDHEFASIEASLLALATSTRLATGDLEGFTARAASALKNMNADGIVLTDLAGRVLLSTQLPNGAPIPEEAHGLPVRRIVESGRPAVSDLFSAPSMGGLVFAVGIPFVRGGSIVGSLNATVLPRQLGRLLEQQHLPQSWLSAVLDSTGAIVVRSRDTERYAGLKPAQDVIAHLTERDEADLVSRSLDGTRVSVVYSRSPASRWAVAVGIPVEELRAEMRQWMARLVGICFAALLLGLLLAWFIGGRIARSIGALAEPARRLGSGGAIEIPRLHLQEAVTLGHALVDAGIALDKARHDAHHDPLTGLANRVLLDLFINQQLAVCRRYQRAMAVLFIDLDGFKVINDTHGHALGDQLLCAVSSRILHSIRGSDIAARLGGDEFAICLLDTELSGAQCTAQKLIGVLSQPFIVAGIEASISASIGVAGYPASADVDTLLRNADRAMYQAKALGKNQVCMA